MKTLDRKVLHLLEEDPKLTAENLATMLDKEVGEIKELIERYEKNGVIVGYRTLIDWEDTDIENVTALIELKVTPSRDRGYDKVAEKLAPCEGVISTATHFVLRKYKTEGVVHGAKAAEDKREKGILM